MSSMFSLSFRTLFMFLVLLSVLSCASRHRTIQQASSTQLSHTQLSADSSAYSLLQLIRTGSHRSLKLKFTHTVFDSTLPPHPHSGARPVLSSTQGVVQIEEADSTIQSQYAHATSVSGHTSATRTEQQHQEQVVSRAPFLTCLTRFIAALAGIVLLLFLFRFLCSRV